MIALNFDYAIFDGATAAASGLECFCQRFNFVQGHSQARDQGNSFAVAAFGVECHTDFAVTQRRIRFDAGAAAVINSFTTARAEPSLVCTKYTIEWLVHTFCRVILIDE